MVELPPLGRVHGHHRDGAPGRGRRRLLLGKPRLRHGGQVAREVPRRRGRFPSYEPARQVGELRDIHEPLDRLRLRCEHLLAAQPDPLDKPVDEPVRRHLLEGAARRPVDPQEVEGPVATLR